MSLSDRINDTNAAPWVIEEIKRLEAERDAWQRMSEQYKREAYALAAALADIRLAASFAAPGFAKEIERRTKDPATSLARRDAEKQAEALEALAEKLRWGHVVDAIKEEADKLRRQAEGGE